MTEVCIRQTLTHQSFPGECASLGRCSRGSVSLPNVWVAVPFVQELGTGQTILSDVAKGLSKNSRRSLKELPGLSRQRERIKRARHEERARDMRVEDPEQGPDREAIEGTGASSSRVAAENEPPSCPAVKPRLLENSDDADMSDHESDRRRHRELVGEERETRRVRFNVLDGEESDGDRRRMGANPLGSPTRSVLSPRLSGWT